MRLEVGAIRFVSMNDNSPLETTLIVTLQYRELHWHTAAEVCMFHDKS